MAVRGKRNPFPQKMKPTTTVFSTPQKMDPAPAALKKARTVAASAMASNRKGLGGGMSASKVKAYACRGSGSR